MTNIGHIIIFLYNITSVILNMAASKAILYSSNLALRAYLKNSWKIW